MKRYLCNRRWYSTLHWAGDSLNPCSWWPLTWIWLRNSYRDSGLRLLNFPCNVDAFDELCICQVTRVVRRWPGLWGREMTQSRPAGGHNTHTGDQSEARWGWDWPMRGRGSLGLITRGADWQYGPVYTVHSRIRHLSSQWQHPFNPLSPISMQAAGWRVHLYKIIK